MIEQHSTMAKNSMLQGVTILGVPLYNIMWHVYMYVQHIRVPVRIVFLDLVKALVYDTVLYVSSIEVYLSLLSTQNGAKVRAFNVLISMKYL